MQQLKSSEVETPFPNLPLDSSVMRGLCDLTAYSELLAKVADSRALEQQNGALEDIRMIIEQNVKDACQWVGFQNILFTKKQNQESQKH
jgi:hypothetical protein